MTYRLVLFLAYKYPLLLSLLLPFLSPQLSSIFPAQPQIFKRFKALYNKPFCLQQPNTHNGYYQVSPYPTFPSFTLAWTKSQPFTDRWATRNTVNQASESVQGAMSGASKQGNEGKPTHMLFLSFTFSTQG